MYMVFLLISCLAIILQIRTKFTTEIYFESTDSLLECRRICDDSYFPPIFENPFYRDCIYYCENYFYNQFSPLFDPFFALRRYRSLVIGTICGIHGCRLEPPSAKFGLSFTFSSDKKKGQENPAPIQINKPTVIDRSDECKNSCVAPNIEYAQCIIQKCGFNCNYYCMKKCIENMQGVEQCHKSCC